MNKVINIQEKFKLFTDIWSPKRIGKLNGQQILLAKIKGEFFIVPKGVLHKPIAREETHLLLFEPLSTKHTGDVLADITVETYEEI